MNKNSLLLVFLSGFLSLPTVSNHLNEKEVHETKTYKVYDNKREVPMEEKYQGDTFFEKTLDYIDPSLGESWKKWVYQFSL